MTYIEIKQCEAIAREQNARYEIIVERQRNFEKSISDFTEMFIQQMNIPLLQLMADIRGMPTLIEVDTK